ncbi:MAG: hypothetical protein ACXABY_14745 [Candidatus Thorarchaeota archaeon]|jgi:hypothetical protein
MADPRKPDDRSRFFDNEREGREKKRPRITSRTGWAEALSIERERRANVGEALYEAAEATQQVIISYTKITEDYATRIWTVEPYSYRYKWLTAGGDWNPRILKKVFYGYDVDDDQIKMFMFGNIHDVTMTQTTFSPRWEIEVTWTSTAGPMNPFGTGGPEI